MLFLFYINISLILNEYGTLFFPYFYILVSIFKNVIWNIIDILIAFIVFYVWKKQTKTKHFNLLQTPKFEN